MCIFITDLHNLISSHCFLYLFHSCQTLLRRTWHVLINFRHFQSLSAFFIKPDFDLYTFDLLSDSRKERERSSITFSMAPMLFGNCSIFTSVPRLPTSNIFFWALFNPLSYLISPISYFSLGVKRIKIVLFQKSLFLMK